MSRPVLLDASAIIAYIRKEPGGEEVLHALMQGKQDFLVSAVQLVEVEGKLVSDGSFTPEQVRSRIHRLGHLLEVVASCWSARWRRRFPVAGGLKFRPPATQFLATP